MNFPTLLTAMFLIAGCASDLTAQTRPAPPPERTAGSFPARPAPEKRGLDAIMGQDIATLKRLFGEPRLDVVEVYGRKLQFTGKVCILDAYLYPDGRGGTEIVTYVDARRSDGAAVDKASCIDALIRH